MHCHRPLPQRRSRFLLPLLFPLLALSACSLLGIQSGLSFDEKLASAYTIHTTVVQTTTSALQAGAIKSADADKVSAMANTSRSILDAAKAAETAGDTTGATSKLQLANDALKAIKAYLATSQKTAPPAAAAKKGA